MAFNSHVFMQQAIGKMSTERPVVPAGEYAAIIDTFDSEKWFKSKETQDENGVRSETHRVVIPLILMDVEDLKEELGMQKIMIHYNIFLDVVDNRISFDEGRNWRLGQLREVTDTNYENEPWWFNHLEGKMLRVVVTVTSSAENGKQNNVTMVKSADVD